VNQGAPLLQVRDLKKYFPVRRGFLIKSTVGQIRAVDGISFNVHRGETLGLVGESGCGKSTTGRVIMRVMPPTAGKVRFQEADLHQLKGAELRQTRMRMQMIFQDPYASLNPRMSVGRFIEEPLIIHTQQSSAERNARLGELLELVGLDPRFGRRYPHEFSGGQRQRIGIARALALNPDFVLCDEPISALDVSVQAQVVNLLQDLQEQLGLTYLFIAHDLSMVRHISDRVAVMYLGKLMEKAGKEDLYASPLHPYTQALLSAVPVADPTVNRQRIILQGDVPSPANPPPGCVFNTRCPLAEEICFKEIPELREVEPGHFAACHLVAPAERP
jgi:oligopeptide transport system ATP-binding protein